jgi:hypothetical protein
MPEEQTGNAQENTRIVKKLTLPDGFRVGIMNLDNILREVANLNLNDNQIIKNELLERVKECNYVASSAEKEYMAALFREYQRKWGQSGDIKEGFDPQTGKIPGG